MFADRFFQNALHEMQAFDRYINREFERPFGRYYRPFDIIEPRRSLFDFDNDFLALEDSLSRPFRGLNQLSLRNPESLPLRDVDENTEVYIKQEINNNGHVWKKTMEKKPGEQWKTHVEEFDMGKKSLKDGEAPKELKNSEEQKALKEVKESPKKSESGKESPKRLESGKKHASGHKEPKKHVSPLKEEQKIAH